MYSRRFKPKKKYFDDTMLSCLFSAMTNHLIEIKFSSKRKTINLTVHCNWQIRLDVKVNWQIRGSVPILLGNQNFQFALVS